MGSNDGEAERFAKNGLVVGLEWVLLLGKVETMLNCGRKSEGTKIRFE